MKERRKPVSRKIFNATGRNETICTLFFNNDMNKNIFIHSVSVLIFFSVATTGLVICEKTGFAIT